MRDQTQPGVLPLRPLTTGELLDAAVVLLRARGGHLIAWGVSLALAEQALLFPLRRMADVDNRYLPADDSLFIFGVMIAVGFGTEALSIASLGAMAARHSPGAMLGPRTPAIPRSRLAPALVASLIGAVVCAGSAWAFLLLPAPLGWVGLFLSVLLTALFWPFVYGLLGLAATSAVIDRRGPFGALLRSLRLTSRNFLRGMWIRVLGYLAWLLIRLGLSLAVVAIINLVYSSPSTTVDTLLLSGAWLVVNALAYPVLGCLDVALHLETQMRTEGLDLALSRTLRRAASPERSPR